MKHLNSVLFEGELLDDPRLVDEGSPTPECAFEVSSLRQYTTVNGEDKEEQTRMVVLTYGRLAETCAEYLSRGREVRVVGRLHSEVNMSPETMIVAEHVEFRPWRGKEAAR